VHRTGQLYGHFENTRAAEGIRRAGHVGFSGPPKCCSSAACSSLTPSIAVRSARPSAPGSNTLDIKLGGFKHRRADHGALDHGHGGVVRAGGEEKTGSAFF